MSIRRIATLVFGDARYRGRVERILRRPETAQRRPEHASRADSNAELEAALDALAAAGDEAPSLEELVASLRKQLTNGTGPVSIRELEVLFKLERALETRATLKRLNDLTRETD
jgi:hypothetical protein